MIRFSFVLTGILYNRSHYKYFNEVLTSAYRLESSISKSVKGEIEKQLIAIKEECRGQGLDLADMADAIKMASNSFHSTWKIANITESKIQGKVVTLSSSLKSYSMRLANLQNESRCIQSEAETLRKLINNSNVENDTAKFSDKLTEEIKLIKAKSTTNSIIDQSSNNNDNSEKCKNASTQKYSSKEEEEKANNSNFTVEKPRLAEVLENVSATKPQEYTDQIHKESMHVEECHEKNTEHHLPEEIDINAIEIEPPLTDIDGAKDVSEEMKDDNLSNISVNDITRELFERGVDFTDCHDEITLRQRYKEKIIEADKQINRDNINTHSNSSSHGTKTSQYSAASLSSFNENNKYRHNANQPPLPTKPDNFTQQQQYYEKHTPPPPPPQYSQNNNTGLVNDPYPNGERKMFDAGKYIWQIKQEIASEKNVSADMIELWCNKVCLADPMRLCDYPNAQSFPIEVHQKGYVPY